MRASIFATFVFTNLTRNCKNLCCKYVASKIIIGKISEMFKFSHILKFFAKKLLLTNYTWEERFKSLKVSKSPTRVNPSNVLNKSQIKSHVFIVEYSKKYILSWKVNTLSLYRGVLFYWDTGVQFFIFLLKTRIWKLKM